MPPGRSILPVAAGYTPHRLFPYDGAIHKEQRYREVKCALFLLVSALLLLYWLLVPTVLSLLVPKPAKLGREATAAGLSILSWMALSRFLPIGLVPHGHPIGATAVWLWASVLGYAVLFALGLERRHPGSHPQGMRGDFLTLALLIPLDEELLFRGLLFSASLPALGPLASALYTAVLFSIAHELGRLGGDRRSLRQSAADLTFGVLAGTLYAGFHSIVVPIALHIVVNGLHALGRPPDDA